MWMFTLATFSKKGVCGPYGLQILIFATTADGILWDFGSAVFSGRPAVNGSTITMRSILNFFWLASSHVSLTDALVPQRMHFHFHCFFSWCLLDETQVLYTDISIVFRKYRILLLWRRCHGPILRVHNDASNPKQHWSHWSNNFTYKVGQIVSFLRCFYDAAST